MENLFISDEDIKITKSPFSRFENEVKVYDGAKRNISVAESMFKVNTGKVRELDFIIIEALNVLEFATSRMITQFLNLNGYDVKQMKVSEKMKKLNRFNIITRFKFKTDETEINTRFYCLEKAGSYLLKSREVDCDWKVSDNTKPISIIKRILARNQVMLAYANKVEYFSKYRISPKYKLLKSVSTFKPHLEVDISTENEKEKFWFEVVRSYDGYIEKMLERINKHIEFYEYYSRSNDIPTLPYLVIVGEDTKHLISIVQNIQKNKLKLKGREFLYTTDLQLLEGKLNRSLYKLEMNDSNTKAKLTLQDHLILK